MMTGRTITHYEILERLGQGGMGVVYRAQDTRLDRTVALKFLSTSALPTDDDKARFFREARAAAKLNHRHIAHVYEIDETDQGQAFIAMEYVEGQTLSAKIKQGPLKLQEAITIATQVAEGLQAAHEQGIVHRDIKSSNVMLTDKGQIKVMDFGLARMAGASVLTKEGTAMGTVSYMSPEQARGEAVDHRTDIWSLGVVLYEMVSGRLPFAGDYEQAVVYAILNEDPEALTGLRTGVPMDLERVVLKCLAKSSAHRYQHVDEVAVDLKVVEIGSGGALTAGTTPTFLKKRGGHPSRWYLWTGVVILALLAGALAGGPIRRITQPASQVSVPQLVKRLTLDLPEEAPLALIGLAPYASGQTALALSPDGSHLVYVAEHEGATQLYQRKMDEREATPLPGTEGASFPFFSPDGNWVGFFAAGRLKKISLQGGEPLILCEVRNPHGAAWTPDGRIIFADKDAGQLAWVPASGGDAQDLGAGSGQWPAMLPGDKAVLVYDYWAQSIDLVILESGARKPLVEKVAGGAGNPRYVPSGHLVFAQRGRLMAAPFDLDRLEVTGSPVPVVEQVRTEALTSGQHTISQEGTLLYVPGGSVRVGQLKWVDRRGENAVLPFEPAFFETFRLSPDGRRLAISVLGARWDIWIYDLESSLTQRLTTEGNNLNPVWTPEGDRVVFRSDRDGVWKLYGKRADGTGEARPFTLSQQIIWPDSWSPDGGKLIFAAWSSTSSTSSDLWELPMEGEGTPRPLVQTAYEEAVGRFSPDGRYLAYHSNESGQYEVYVQPYPGGEGRRQVSSGGGMDPIWSPSGDELFYHNGPQLMAARIEWEPVLAVGTRRVMFESSFLSFPGPIYDLGPDGRFLLLESVEEASTSTQLNVVVNWFEDLKRRVPTGE